MDGIVLAMAQVDSEMIPLTGMVLGTLIAVVAIVASAARKVLTTRQVERTKREVAAYVAEGTISPADADRLLGRRESDFETKVGQAVSWGKISAEEGERLIKAFRDDGDRARA